MSLPSLLASSTMSGPTNPKQPLVLIADDDRALRKLLNLALVQEGYSVVQASSGEQVLQDFQRLQPDMVLLDAMMPEMDGFEACRYLRTVYKTNIPILIVTVLDDQQSIDQAYEVGATDFITKPIHWAVLRQRVRHLLDSQRSLQQAQHMAAQLASAQAWETLQRQFLKEVSAAAPLPQSVSQYVEPIKACFAAQQVGVLPAATTHPKAFDIAATVALGQEQIIGIVTVLEQMSTDRVGVIQWPPEAAQVGQDGDEARNLLAIAQTFNTSALLIAPIVCFGRRWGWLMVTRPTATLWAESDQDRLQDLAYLIALSLNQGGAAIPQASEVKV